MTAVNSTGKDAAENAVLMSKGYTATAQEKTMTDITNFKR